MGYRLWEVNGAGAGTGKTARRAQMSLETQMREKYPDATVRTGKAKKKTGNRTALRIAGATLAALIVGSALVSCGTETVSPASGATPASATKTPAKPSATAAKAPAAKPTATRAPASKAPASRTPEAAQAPAAAGTALAMLTRLEVKGRAPKTGYTRQAFGPAWKDVDHNGCDTRNDVLAAQLSHVTYTGSVPCQVKSGTLIDPFSGKTIGFLRGQTTSGLVQIDHVVPLSDAWQKGAQKLSAERREAVANDPMNLVATDGPLNGQKGDSDAATWLPPLKSSRCDYVARQIAVKDRYDLWVTTGEHAAMSRILATCPKQPAITSALKTKKATTSVAGTAKQEPTRAPAAKRAPEPQQTTAPAGDVFYQNCTAVRAAGAGPIRTGDPGYSRKLDRDGDGVGCE